MTDAIIKKLLEMAAEMTEEQRAEFIFVAKELLRLPSDFRVAQESPR